MKLFESGSALVTCSHHLARELMEETLRSPTPGEPCGYASGAARLSITPSS